MRRKVNKYFLIACFALGCYVNTLYGKFVFDDSEAIVKNKDVLPSTPLSEVFQNDFWGTDISLNVSHKSYRPLTILTYRLNVLFSNGKLNPMHMHLTNVVLYLILCMMTLPIFNLFLKRKKSDEAYFASVLFAVHPVHSEVVAGLVGRADLLSSILFFLSVILYKQYLKTTLYKKYVKSKSYSLFILIIFIVICAVLCKETAITALAMLIVYDALHSKVLKKENFLNIFQSGKPFIFRSLILAVAGIVVLYFRFYVMNFEGPTFTAIDNPAAYSHDLFSRIFTYNYLYFLNLLILIWPQWLCFDWSMGCIPLVESLCDIRLIFIVTFWVICLYIFIKFLKDIWRNRVRKRIILGISLMIIPFIPASNLFLKVGFVIAERTLLLPSAGFCMLVAHGYCKYTRRYPKHKHMAQLGFYVFCLLFSIRTVYRNSEWLTEESLFTSALNVCPNNAKVHYNIGKVAADKNLRQLALYEYNKAIELNPNYEQAMNNLANLLRDDKQFTEAEKLLRKAVEVRPNFAAAWMNLGIVLSNLNQSQEAEECYLTAIKFRNKYPDCYYNLGNLYLDMKRNEEALSSWRKAVSYKPTHTSAWSNTLVLLDSLGRFEEVLKLSKIALEHNPKSPALHFSIGNTLGKLHQYEKAESHFKKALKYNPNNPLYYSNLGVLYHRWGKPNSAREMYTKALNIDPSMKTTASNLKKLNNEK